MKKKYFECVAEKFWSKVYQPKEGCWEWKGGFKKKYGSFYFQGKRYAAHRVSFVLSNDDIDDDNEILHECDNPSCCRPDHLKQGSHQQNINDAFKRGRPYINTVSKLSHGKAQFIKFICTELNISSRNAAKLFKVHRRTIQKILSGTHYAN